MKNALPWFKCFPAEMLVQMQTLSFEEKGIFTSLLFLKYAGKNSIPLKEFFRSHGKTRYKFSKNLIEIFENFGMFFVKKQGENSENYLENSENYLENSENFSKISIIFSKNSEKINLQKTHENRLNKERVAKFRRKSVMVEEEEEEEVDKKKNTKKENSEKDTPSQSDGVRTENEKPEKPNLQKFGKRIAMTEAEHAGLVETFGETLTAEQIAIADDWLLSKGKTQRDYCAFMRNWLRKTKAQADLAAKRQATFATRYTPRQAVQTPDYEAGADDLRRRGLLDKRQGIRQETQETDEVPF